MDQSITLLRPCGARLKRCENNQTCTCREVEGKRICDDARVFEHSWIWESPSSNQRVCTKCGQKEPK